MASTIQPKQRNSPPRAVDLLVLARRASMLADFLDDEGRRALAVAARNLAGELNLAAAIARRSHLRRVA